VWSVSIHFAI